MTTTPQDDWIRAYHLTSAEHAISNVSLRRLKVARFSEVNDPFELFALNCLKRERRKALDVFRNSQDSRIGLLSFSERWKSPVLWSHYAAGHKGICLGFDIRRTLGVRGVQRVRYEDSRLTPLGDDPNPRKIPADLQELLFVTKFKHWDYEEELRVFVELSKATKEVGLYFYPFSEDLRLREVILGHLCPVSIEPIRILVHATNPGALVSKARLGFKYFEVKRDAHYPPQ